jgi:adenylosuccinate synthase
MDSAQYSPNGEGVLIKNKELIVPEYEKRAQDSFVKWLVLGAGYGDEGKGKVTDALMEWADVAVRFQWGHNAGHTVKVWDQTFDLHIIPSGLVYPWKEGIIARTCVLWVDLPKLRSRVEKSEDGKVIWSMFEPSSDGRIISQQTLDEIVKRKPDSHEIVRWGLLPEINQLASKWAPVNGRLFIAEDTPLIGYHHILIDAWLEQARESNNLRLIGSTGTGIAPAYATIPLRYNMSIGSALRASEEYFQSMRAEWLPYATSFPYIDIDELITEQKKQIETLRGLYNSGTIKIDNEQEKIDEYRKAKKWIVWEGAQSVLIGSGHSIYGTASMPDVSTFCAATGIRPEEIANIFPVLKLPPSSVGTRPLQFMKYVESEALGLLRMQYQEFWVSTRRPRDLMKISLVEIAQAVKLILAGMPEILHDRVVPVLNRVDGLHDFSTLSGWQIPVITGFTYTRPRLEWIGRIYDIIHAGIYEYKNNKIPEITPSYLLKNYPSRGDWSSEYMFWAYMGSTSMERTVWWDFQVTTEQIWEAVHYVIQYIMAAMFAWGDSREVILGTSPDRSGLVLARDITPHR